MGRRRLLGLGALAVAVVLAVAGFVLWPRGTTEITPRQAVEDFRERGSTGTAEGTTSTRSTRPTPGVYTYAAAGQEEVKLGPLPAQTRPLPDTVTAVVVERGDDCFEWTLNLFTEHTEDTLLCTDGTALRLDGHTKHQQIGALSPTATMTCDPDVLTGPGDDPTPLRCELTLSGGPASIAATLEGSATAEPAETSTIGGTEVAVTPVTVHYGVTGDLTGSWTETTWWSEGHLPVRIERTLDLRGLATFSERSSLELVDLQPTS